MSVSVLGADAVVNLLTGSGIALPRRCPECLQWRDAEDFGKRQLKCDRCRENRRNLKAANRMEPKP